MIDFLPFETGFLIVGALVVLMTGISKSGFAAGLEMSAVPIMAVFIAPPLAAAIMLPILLTIDGVNLWRYRHHWNRRVVGIMLPAALVGIALGAFMFGSFDADLLRLFLGILCVVFVAQRLFQLGKSGDRSGREPSRLFTFVFGSLAGLTSFIAHAGGPAAKIVLIRYNLEKQQFVGTNSYLFAAINVLKLFPYLLLGQITWESMKGSLAFAPFIPIGVLIGFWLNNRVTQRQFNTILLIALTVVGLKLIVDGIDALM